MYYTTIIFKITIIYVKKLANDLFKNINVYFISVTILSRFLIVLFIISDVKKNKTKEKQIFS